jgi:hypothetical protein
MTVSDAQMTPPLVNDDGDLFWVVDALDVRAAQAPITFAANPADPFTADSVAVNTFTGSGATPNSLVRLPTTLGTFVDTNASAPHTGFQVQADPAGNFAFGIQRTYAAATSTITAEEVNGASHGTATGVYTPLAVRDSTSTPAATRRSPRPGSSASAAVTCSPRPAGLAGRPRPASSTGAPARRPRWRSTATATGRGQLLLRPGPPGRAV